MEQYIKEGRLAPDEIVIGMIANYVAGHKEAKGCIFDGFPRTTVQAEEFDRILAGHGLKVDIMVDIHVPEEELVKRILLRGKDSGRADDASGGGDPRTAGRLSQADGRGGGLLRLAEQVCVGGRRRHDGRGVRPHRRGDRRAEVIRRSVTKKLSRKDGFFFLGCGSDSDRHSAVLPFPARQRAFT